MVKDCDPFAGSGFVDASKFGCDSKRKNFEWTNTHQDYTQIKL